MKKSFLILISSLLFTALVAQNQWSLSQCIEYALTTNIDIMRVELNTAYQENNLQQSKDNRLPNLNADISQSFGFGRSLDIDNTYVNSQSALTGFSVTSGMVVWQGGQLKNTIQQREYELKSSLEDLQKAKDDMIISISQYYLQILLAEELVKVAEVQLEQTNTQIQRTQKLVDAGTTAEGVLLEIQAQGARESLELVNAKNSYRMALLNLAQILELDDYTGFEISKPELPEVQAEHSLLTSKAVYDNAVATRPEIKSAEYMLESSASQLKIAKAGKLPSLTASAGLYDQYQVLSTYETSDFAQQMKDNSRSSVGLNLSVPIFNRNLNNTSIKNAEIQIENKKLELEATKKELRRQIEQSYINALASYERYHANKLAVESMELSFHYMEQKFDMGRVNSVDYSDAKTRLAQAQSDLVQAKFEFIFRTKILDFYNGIPIVL